jgi:hypothetical protein
MLPKVQLLPAVQYYPQSNITVQCHLKCNYYLQSNITYSLILPTFQFNITYSSILPTAQFNITYSSILLTVQYYPQTTITHSPILPTVQCYLKFLVCLFHRASTGVGALRMNIIIHYFLDTSAQSATDRAEVSKLSQHQYLLQCNNTKPMAVRCSCTPDEGCK